MDALAARTFVVAFLLVYVGLLLALVGWNLRKWLGGRSKKGLLRRQRRHTRDWPALHHSDRSP